MDDNVEKKGSSTAEAAPTDDAAGKGAAAGGPSEPAASSKGGGDAAAAASAVAKPATGSSSTKAAPPTVITVDTSGKAEGSAAATAGNVGVKQEDSASTGAPSAASQARTPKHANKNSEEQTTAAASSAAASSSNNNHGDAGATNSGGAGAASAQGAAAAAAAAAAAPPPPHPRPFEGRMGGSGAFQPHYHQQQQQGRMPPMQVSPGSGRYYSSYNGPPPPPPPPGANRFGPPPPYGHDGGPPHPPPPYGPPGFQQRGPPYGGGGGGAGMYQQHYDNSSHGGPPSWGPPPSFPHGRPPAYPMNNHHHQQDYHHHNQQQQGPPPPPPQHHHHQQQQQPPPGAHQQQGPPPHPPQQGHANANRGESNSTASGSNTFSRAVSSSFDRSIKSRDDKKMDLEDKDNHSVSGDASWGQLNQVASVDEEEMRKRLSKRENAETPEAAKELQVAASNSSSLTNSPTEGVDAKKQQSKAHSSLDSLSSVASAQAPMKSTSAHNLNDTGSHASLDLMKCASGSSALLLSSHQRHDSQFSFSHDAISTSKRSHDEERGDVEDSHHTETVEEEIRKAPSAEEGSRPSKKKKVEKDPNKKSSPLSIECSPPTSPAPEKRKGDGKMKHAHAMFGPEPPSVDSFYDKPPAYTYSLDSAPPMPRESGGAHHHPPHGLQPPRPGSSSSTITPMNVEATPNTTTATTTLQEHNTRHQPGVGPIPSWDIQPQDSFGAGSAHASGGALMSSFSFTQDYPMLGASASHDQGHGGGGVGVGSHHGQQHHHHHLESRNQSFDGHYHRSDSMMSYEGQGSTASMPPYDGRGNGGGGNGGYHGPFPPQAPSWGSASSYPQYGHGHGGQYQNYPPPMMRNFSEDSGARTSPPPGPGGMRVMQRGFQPPPEFRAPPSMVQKGASQPQHIISSPYGGKGGSYGWSKGEDMRLTEIMKKYKNPRDWEPIAKEHNCGRSAKECHERWIRYLKPGVRKGQWTDHEDAIVMDVVTSSSEQPFNRWSDLAQRLPGRVGKQIRDRWVNHLNPNINHLPFSREDDLLLWEGHKKLGKRWVEISTKYFNSSRSENHIKNRWYSASFKKFITNEFGAEAYSGGKSSKKDSPSKKKKDGGSSSNSGGTKPSSPSKRQGPTDPTKVEAV